MGAHIVVEELVFGEGAGDPGDPALAPYLQRRAQLLKERRRAGAAVGPEIVVFVQPLQALGRGGRQRGVFSNMEMSLKEGGRGEVLRGRSPGVDLSADDGSSGALRASGGRPLDAVES